MRRLLTLIVLLSLLFPSAAGSTTGSPGSHQTDQAASIGDLVWYDADANGSPGAPAQEPGLPAVVVCLYADTEGDGLLGPSDSLLDCQSSAVDGSYHFTGLAAGQYLVTVDAGSLVPVYRLTTANDPLSVTLATGQAFDTADFGFRYSALADVTVDCRVDIRDVQRVAAHWGTQAGGPGWVPLYDLNGDNWVTVADLVIAAEGWPHTATCDWLDPDHDWLPTRAEDANSNGVVDSGETDPALADTDADGLDDYQESITYATNPLAPDSDGDGLVDPDEVLSHSADPWDVDSDDDGAPDGLEAHTMHTDPVLADTDGDGLADPLEDANRNGGIDPGETDPLKPDTDQDGLWDGHTVSGSRAALQGGPVTPMAATMPGELDYGTDPRNPDTDGDALGDGEEVRFGTSPVLADSDGDGLLDGEEVTEGADGYVTDPLAADSDGDTVDDGDEATLGCNPLLADTDGDELSDPRERTRGTGCADPDSDDDGLTDGVEVDVHGTNPLLADTDGDTMPDRWEIESGLNAIAANASADDDTDGLTNLEEYQGADGDPATPKDATQPLNPDTDEDLLSDGVEVLQRHTDPKNADSDGDQARDGDEVRFGTDPLAADSDGDQCLDGVEPAWATDVDGDGSICALDTDCDGDGIADGQEDSNHDGLIAGDTNNNRRQDPGEVWAETDPAAADSDNDGMPDNWETAQGFDPKDAADGSGDADGDDLSNTLEYSVGSDPHDTDSDDDSLPDGFEYDHGLNPVEPADADGDLDGDGLSNRDEYTAAVPIDNPDADDDGLRDGEEPLWNGDTDGDGAIDALDDDADDDGLIDGTEVFSTTTSPVLADSDGDTLGDGDEVNIYHTDPLSQDTDLDTLSDSEELTAGADGYITNPLSQDTDGDRLNDDVEETPAIGTNPTLPDTDGDQADDGQEVAIGSNPLDPDTDDDGLLDGQEIARGTSPTDPDTDGDGVSDGLDPDPLDPDMDDDGLLDGQEALLDATWYSATQLGPGQVIADPAAKFGQAVVHPSGSATLFDLTVPAVPDGDYRLMVHARGRPLTVTLTNPGFELDPPGAPCATGWNFSAPSGNFNCMATGALFHAGARSVQVTRIGPPGPAGLPAELSQTLPLAARPNEVWVLSAFVRQPNATVNLAADVGLIWWNGDAIVGQSWSNGVRVKGAWWPLALEASPPGEATAVEVRLRVSDLGGGAGSIYFDDAWLQREGDRLAISVDGGSPLAPLETHPLRAIYRWISSPTFDFAGGELHLHAEDLEWAEGQIVAVDRVLLVDVDNGRWLFTDALDPDTDGDGLLDGKETALRGRWYEAEHFKAADAAILETALASNGMEVAPTTGPLATIADGVSHPPGDYQIYVRSRTLEADDVNQVRIIAHSNHGSEDYLVTPNRLAGIDTLTGQPLIAHLYEWQGVNDTTVLPTDPPMVVSLAGTIHLAVTSTITVELRAWGFDALNVRLDRVLLIGEGMMPAQMSDYTSNSGQEGRVNWLERPVLAPRLTDPIDPDTDLDGHRPFDGFLTGSQGYLTDGFEWQAVGSNPFAIDTDLDTDPDHLDAHPLTDDIDDDGLKDRVELAVNGGYSCPPGNVTLPIDADSDEDGILDGNEDVNLNHLHDAAEADPTCWDTDLDSLVDGLERGLAEPEHGFGVSAAGISLTVAPPPAAVAPVPGAFWPDHDPSTVTNPASADSDGDGLCDGNSLNQPAGCAGGEDYNAANANDPNNLNGQHDWNPATFTGETAAHTADSDGDGVCDGQNVAGCRGELTVQYPGGSTTNPLKPDSDGDGLADGFEVHSIKATDPSDPDTDGDLAGDGQEVLGLLGYKTDPTDPDSDGDGLNDYAEMTTGSGDPYVTSPLLADTDADGLDDQEEVTEGSDDYFTDPTDADSDDDGLSDGEEAVDGDDGWVTNSTSKDTDGDGFPDKYEGDNGADPTDANNKPPGLLAGSMLLQVTGDDDWVKQTDGSFVADGVVTFTSFGSGAAQRAVRSSMAATGLWRGTAAPERGSQGAHAPVVSPAALQRLLRPADVEIKLSIDGRVTVSADGLEVTADGDLLVPLGGGVTVTLAEDSDYEADPVTGVVTVTGTMKQNVQIGPWGFARFDTFDESRQVTIDTRTGEIRGKATVRLTMIPGPVPQHNTLTSSFIFTPTARALYLYTRDATENVFLDMIGMDNDYTMGEAELFINVETESYRGKVKLLDWELGDEFFEGGGPSLDVGWDKPRDRYWFKASLQAGVTIKAGGLSLSVSPPVGGKFGFEVGIDRPYLLVEAALEVPPISEVLSINDVQLEIDPSGSAVLTPTYPVGTVLTEPITGHIRLLGDVTVHIPLPIPVEEREARRGEQGAGSGAREPREEVPSLDIHVAGEQLWRIDMTGGCNHAYAANATLGMGVSVLGVGLMYDFAGSSMLLQLGGAQMPACTPDLLAIAMVQNGVQLGHLGSNPILNELGKINLEPEIGVAAEFDISEGTMTLAGVYEVGPFDMEASFVLDAYAESMSIAATLDTAFLDGDVSLTGSLDFDGVLTLAGDATVGLAGFDVFDASFAFTNDPNAAHMLTADGTLTIPLVGAAGLHGWLDADGRFDLAGAADLSPGGFNLASASLHWTNVQLTVHGSLHVIGADVVTVDGTFTPTSFSVSGNGSLHLGGFSMTANVTLNNSGLYAGGGVSVAGATLTMGGYILTNGSFLLTASGTVTLRGYQFASASFTLTPSSFDATADLKLGSHTLASAGIHFSTDGSFNAAISIDWGFTFTASMAVSTSGGFDFYTAFQDLGLSHNGYGLTGSFRLHVWGTSSINASFDGRGSAQVKLSGVTVFSGSISVSSAGKITVSCSTPFGTVSVTFTI
jgi:hypothetical protein